MRYTINRFVNQVSREFSPSELARIRAIAREVRASRDGRRHRVWWCIEGGERTTFLDAVTDCAVEAYRQLPNSTLSTQVRRALEMLHHD